MIINFSLDNLKVLKKEITSNIVESVLIEIESFEKIENNNVSIFFETLPIVPKYTNQINILGIQEHLIM